MAAFLPETDSEDELPGEWEERVTVDGSVYYANHANSSTQWTHPRTGKKKSVSANMPFGWERVIMEGNKVVYVDNINKRTTFTDPRLAFAKEISSGKHDSSFRQKHDASSTAQHVLHGRDLTGHVALVTGGNSGVGYHTCRALAMQQCTVVMACRNVTKAEQAVADIKKERPQAQIDYIELDLASFNSVRRFVQQFNMRYDSLNYLILNAGVYNTKYRVTEDGLEEMMQVNYLSHFYLTQLLLKTLLNTKNPRIVSLSAESHRFSEISSSQPPSELHFQPSTSNFTPILQYNDSKLFCHLFSRSCHQRLYSEGICSLSVHPGNLLVTNFHRNSPCNYLLSRLCRPFSKDPSQAAASVVLASCSEEDLLSGSDHCYINNCFPTQPSEVATDDTVSGILWDSTISLLKRKLGNKFSI